MPQVSHTSTFLSQSLPWVREDKRRGVWPQRRVERSADTRWGAGDVDHPADMTLPTLHVGGVAVTDIVPVAKSMSLSRCFVHPTT